jgi:hypothetical protein
MRARKLSHWVGRVIAVAAFGIGATFGLASTAAADNSWNVSPDDNSWNVSPDDNSWN